MISPKTDFERITFNVNPGLKRKAKIAAIRKRQTLTDFVTSLLEEKLTMSKN